MCVEKQVRRRYPLREREDRDGQGLCGAALCLFFMVLTAGKELFPA